MSNPNFLAYCRANGRTPSAQLAYDKRAWPGGVMTGFILWIAERKSAFYAVNREAFLDRHTIVDLKAWKKFLKNSPTTYWPHR